MRRAWPWLVLAVLLVLGATGAAWLLLPADPPDPGATDDTGLGPEATDQLLQEIGYLKGSPR